jgi:hypothetical protein
MYVQLAFKLTTRALFLQIGLANLSTGGRSFAAYAIMVEALFSEPGSQAIAS